MAGNSVNTSTRMVAYSPSCASGCGSGAALSSSAAATGWTSSALSGSTFIGGGMRGQDPEFANAETVTVGNGAMISANAIGMGTGGQVVVFAERGSG